MRLIEDEFKYKGVSFKVLTRGKKALVLSAKADFYACESIEVWKIRYSKDRTINSVLVTGGEKKPSNEDYPMFAHQYMQKSFNSYMSMLEIANSKFDYYENKED